MAVRQEPGKKTWYVQTSYRDFMGVKRRTTKRNFRTQREAKEWEAEFKRKNNGCRGMTMESLYERYRKNIHSFCRRLPISRNPIMDLK